MTSTRTKNNPLAPPPPTTAKEETCSPTALVPYLPSKCEARVYCKRGVSSIFRHWKRRIVKVKANILLIYKCSRDQSVVSHEHDDSYEEAISLHGFLVRAEPTMTAKSEHKEVISLCHPTSSKKRIYFSSSPATLAILAVHMNAACAKVSLSDFKRIRQIGQGAYGEVVLVQHASSGEYLAMKMMSKKATVVNGEKRSAALVKHVIQERAALEQGKDSPYITQLRYAFQDKERWYLVMEYLQGGELFAFRQKQPNQRFPPSVVCVWAAQLVSAIQLLHRRNIVHRDLKLENLLLDPQFNVRLTDFGLCKNLEVWSALHHTSQNDSPALLAVNSPSDVFSGLSSGGSDLLVPEQSTTISTVAGDVLSEIKEERRTSPFPRSYSFCGTSDYISPEMIISALRPGQRYGYEVDWWALGIVLYELLVGVAPFRATDTMQLYTKILQEPLEWPPGTNLPPECKDLVEQLLNKHPTRRLGKTTRGFESEDDKIIRGHAFFKNIDWDSLDAGLCPPHQLAAELGFAIPTKLEAPCTPKTPRETNLEDYSEWEIRLDGYSYVAVPRKTSTQPSYSTVIGTLTKGSYPASQGAQSTSSASQGPEKPDRSDNSVSNIDSDFHDPETNDRFSFHSQSGLKSRVSRMGQELKRSDSGLTIAGDGSPCLSATESRSVFSSADSRPTPDPDMRLRRQISRESQSDTSPRRISVGSSPPTPFKDTSISPPTSTSPDPARLDNAFDGLAIVENSRASQSVSQQINRTLSGTRHCTISMHDMPPLVLRIDKPELSST